MKLINGECSIVVSVVFVEDALMGVSRRDFEKTNNERLFGCGERGALAHDTAPSQNKKIKKSQGWRIQSGRAGLRGTWERVAIGSRCRESEETEK